MTTHSDNRRDEIIQTASVLFQEKGYQGTTVRELAKLLGIQSGSLFHYFSSKENLLNGVMEKALLNSIATLKQRLINIHDVKKKIHVIIKTELEIIHFNACGGWSVLFSEWRNLSKDNQDNLLKLRDEYNSIWMDAITEGIKVGIIIGDPVVLRRFCFGALSWTANWYKTNGQMNIEELTDQAYYLLVKDADNKSHIANV